LHLDKNATICFYMNEMKLVVVNQDYLSHLSRIESGIYFKKGNGFPRPYVGTVFKVKDFKYFAPIASQQHGHDLLTWPRKENFYFLPINNGEHGGINFGRMIPVRKDGLYELADMDYYTTDDEATNAHKQLMFDQLEFMDVNSEKIQTKAEEVYYLKVDKCLRKACDAKLLNFKKLEKHAYEFGRGKKPQQEKPDVSGLIELD